VRVSEPTADAEVRVGWAADAAHIARIQISSWRRAYAGVFPQWLLDSFDEDEFTERWQHSIARPPDARNRVMVALDHGTVVAFATTGPADDPDSDPVKEGAIAEFHVDPDRTGQGHGSRLLNACVDTLAADGFKLAQIWLIGSDDTMRGFVQDAGWEPDGAHRELDLTGDGSIRVKQVRLHCSLEQDEVQ
jgi:ribosomal protein S18 acetylase RimI-like enzyme